MTRLVADDVRADADLITAAASALRRRGYHATAQSLDVIADGLLDRALRNALLADALDRTAEVSRG